MCQRKEAVQVNDSNSGAKMICQQRAKNGIVPNSGVKIICQLDKNMAKNRIVLILESNYLPGDHMKNRSHRSYN